MLRQCVIPGCETWREGFGVTEVVDHFKTSHGADTIELASKTRRLKLEFGFYEMSEEASTGTMVVKVPLIIEYDGIHLLFVITRWNGRHYFWFYFVEDGILSGGRQFHAELNLISVRAWAPMKKSEGQILVHPITTSIDEIFKDTGKLHFVGDKGMKKNYVENDTYKFEFTLKELPRKIIVLSSPEPSKEMSGIGEEDSIKELEENQFQEFKDQTLLGRFREDTIPFEEVDEGVQLEEVLEDEIQFETETNDNRPGEVKLAQLEPEKFEKIEEESEKVEEESKKVEEILKPAEKIETSAAAAEYSSGSSCGRVVSVACPNCHCEVFKMTTRGKLAITTEFLNQDVRKPVESQREEFSNEKIVNIIEDSEPVIIIEPTKDGSAPTEDVLPEELMDNNMITSTRELPSAKGFSKLDQNAGETIFSKEEGIPNVGQQEKEANEIAEGGQPATELMVGHSAPIETLGPLEQFVLTEEDHKVLEFLQTTENEYQNPEQLFPSYCTATESDKKIWKQVILRAIGHSN